MTSRTVLLLVDDNNALRILLKNSLELAGYAVVDAADGKAALVIAERIMPKLVITDYEMPVINGVQLAQQLRKAYPDLPIIFITAGLLHPIMSQVERWSRVASLRKPFSIDDLVASIKRLLPANPEQSL